MRTTVTIDQIDAWLPQTQCTQCGYPRCRAYAEAIAHGNADINQCPPGGEVTIQALSAVLHISPKPLDPRFGSHKPRARAVIDETLCIGCRKCIDVCPVDAILGARKWMHTVIAHECTGCELCLPPCPVDCIAMVPGLTGHARSASGSPPSPASGRGNEGEGACSSFDFARGGPRLDPIGAPWPEYARAEADHWRARTERRLERLARNRRMRQEKSHRHALTSTDSTPPLSGERERIRAEIRAAVERVKTKKRNRQD